MNTKNRDCEHCGQPTSSRSGLCPECQRRLPGAPPKVVHSIEDVYAQEYAQNEDEMES